MLFINYEPTSQLIRSINADNPWNIAANLDAWVISLSTLGGSTQWVNNINYSFYLIQSYQRATLLLLNNRSVNNWPIHKSDKNEQ